MSYQYNLGLAFQSIASKIPSKIAIRYPDGQSYSFKWLDDLSNQQTRFLNNEGIHQGDVIAIFNEKSEYAFALMLACLKAGVIYTNLDVSSPWPRIEKIINNCQPKAVFFDERDPTLKVQFEKNLSQIPVYNLANRDLQIRFLHYEKEETETSNINGGNPAYIMFTSGSTGFPKGAVMSHNNLLNFIQWGKEAFAITQHDIFTNANPIYFDNSVFDFYTSIFNGCTLVPLSHELVKNAGNLVKAINASGCTIWFSVPSLLVYLLTTKSLTEGDFRSIKRISFGGEGFPKNKLKQLYEMFGDRMTLFNVYGPTECTCICSSYMITSSDFANMNELAPLGNIAHNFSYEILPLDNNNHELGELALAGPCVGLGYYNDRERTSLSFIQNPNSKFNQVMYKTGDIVLRAANGHLHFKGRVDNQIKHMGYRIELEEVEAAFSTLSYINESGVIYEKINADLGQIKAFISVTDKTVDKARVLGDIKSILPPYMIPRIISIMDLLPKNANGKIDRKQLASL